MIARWQPPFKYVILCYMEKYYSQHNEMPSTTHMRDLFQQKRNDDIWERIQQLIAEGYLKRDPSYTQGQRRSAYQFTNKRFSCHMLADQKYMSQFSEAYYFKADREELDIDTYGTTYVGNE